MLCLQVSLEYITVWSVPLTYANYSLANIFEETLCDLFAVCRLGFCVSWVFVHDGMFCRLAFCGGNFTIFGCGKVTKKKKSTMEKHCGSCVVMDGSFLYLKHQQIHWVMGLDSTARTQNAPQKHCNADLLLPPWNTTETEQVASRNCGIFQFAYQIYVLCSQQHFHLSNAANS